MKTLIHHAVAHGRGVHLYHGAGRHTSLAYGQAYTLNTRTLEPREGCSVLHAAVRSAVSLRLNPLPFPAGFALKHA